jgi:hypothetical protein
MSIHPKIDFRFRESKRKVLEGLQITIVCPPHHNTTFLSPRPSLTRSGIEWFRHSLAVGLLFCGFFSGSRRFFGRRRGRGLILAGLA